MSLHGRLLLPCVCRAARGLLNWTQEDLARASGVSRSTVREFENGHHELQRGSERAILAALETAGVAVLQDEQAGPGVRLAKTG